MTFLSTGIASSDRGSPGSVDRLLEYRQNTGWHSRACQFNNFLSNKHSNNSLIRIVRQLALNFET